MNIYYYFHFCFRSGPICKLDAVERKVLSVRVDARKFKNLKIQKSGHLILAVWLRDEVVERDLALWMKVYDARGIEIVSPVG